MFNQFPIQNRFSGVQKNAVACFLSPNFRSACSSLAYSSPAYSSSDELGRLKNVARRLRQAVSHLALLAMPGLFVFLVACGGGGGSSGGVSGTSSAPPRDDTNPVTPTSAGSAVSSVLEDEAYWLGQGEYTANQNLQMIRAAASYASGATGAGQTIGFLDTGLEVSHPEFANPSASSPKVTYYNDASVSSVTDRGRLNHGTSVASIAAGRHGSGYGMQGVAFDASIAMWAVAENGSGLVVNPSILMAAYAALENAHAGVINNSWGTRESYDAAHYMSQRAAMQALFGESLNTIAAGRAIYVMAAGNEGGDHVVSTAALPLYFSALNGIVLAVTSVDKNGVIDQDANRCGAAANFCLSAPGGTRQLTGTTLAASALGGYRRVRGTSFSAAYVSGALAVMKQKFGSQLSNPQYVQRLLQTARKDGIYANRAVYGQGLLDLYAAITPVGSLEIPMPDGGVYPVHREKIRLDSVGGVVPQVIAYEVLALDELGDPFLISFSELGQLRQATRGGAAMRDDWHLSHFLPYQLSPLLASFDGADSSPLSASGHGITPFLSSDLSAGSWTKTSLFQKSGSGPIQAVELLFNRRSAVPDRIAAITHIALPFMPSTRLSIGREAQINQFMGFRGSGLLASKGVGYFDHVTVSQKLGPAFGGYWSTDLSWSHGHFVPRSGLGASFSADHLVDLIFKFSGAEWSGYMNHRFGGAGGKMHLTVPARRNPDREVIFKAIDLPLNDTPRWSVALQRQMKQAKTFMQVNEAEGNVDIRVGFTRQF